MIIAFGSVLYSLVYLYFMTISAILNLSAGIPNGVMKAVGMIIMFVPASV